MTQQEIKCLYCNDVEDIRKTTEGYLCEEHIKETIGENVNSEISDNTDKLICYGNTKDCHKLLSTAKKEGLDFFQVINDPITKERGSENGYCFNCLEFFERKSFLEGE